MTVRIEHANLVVQDVDIMARFIRTAFPEFQIRHEFDNADRSIHIGSDDTYLALSQASREPAEQWHPYSGKPGVNHLGYEVDDVDALRTRMLAGGYRDSTVPNDHPHRKRVYFRDPEGNDWEFVQYFSEAADERNDYEIPG